MHLLKPTWLIKLSRQYIFLIYSLSCFQDSLGGEKSTLAFYCNFHPDLEALPKYHSTVIFMIVNYSKEKFSREHTKYVSTSLNPFLYRTHWHHLTRKMNREFSVPSDTKFINLFDSSNRLLWFIFLQYILPKVTFFLNYFIILWCYFACMYACASHSC